MPALLFPDGAKRDFPAGTTGFDVAKSISPGLAKRAVAVRLDGRVEDLSAEVPDGARIEIVSRDDPDALALIRHDAAHVLAEAVQSLFPGTQVTIGPVIADGFFYDFFRNEPFSTDDFAAIEAKMHEIVAADRPFTRRVVSREEAKRLFADMGERFKVELVDAIPEGEDVKLYAQGDWFDLCRGPHMRSTGQVGKAFKLTKLAGAYWRGDAKGPQLQRIYGTAWASEADLATHLERIAEAERRDHRRIGREMNLFHFQEEAPGQVFWHPNGWRIYTILQDYMRRRQMKGGYVEVNTPQVVDRKLWEASGHWANYREHMFIVEVEEEHAREKRINALKPMNCPCHVQIFNQGLKSYRDLPLRMAEFGACSRYEPSGALHGLMRVRGFRQDDAHIFCSEDQIESECARFIELLASVYRDLGFETFEIRFSTRPEKRVGTEESWDRMEAALENAIKRTGYPYTVDPGEGAFYAPKLDFKLTDAIGREWQCGTFQVDPNLPERLDAEFVGADGNRHRPYMLHRAILGSFERFIGILIENYAGRLPLWLAPVQAVVATITSDADAYAAEVRDALVAKGLHASLDDRNEKITYKVREHSVAKVPLIFVVGRKEAAERTVTIRRLGEEKQETLSLDAAVTRIAAEALAPDRRAAA